MRHRHFNKLVTLFVHDDGPPDLPGVTGHLPRQARPYGSKAVNTQDKVLQAQSPG